MSTYNRFCHDDTSMEPLPRIVLDEDVLLSDSFRKWDGKMSFVCAYIATDGVVVASDTRRIVTDGKTVKECYDDEQKVFQIPGTNILVCLTGACRFGEREEFALADFIKGMNGCNIDEAASFLASRVLSTGAFSELRVTLYQPCIADGKFCTEQRSVFIQPGMDVEVISNQVRSGEGFTQGVDRARDFFHRLWTPVRCSVIHAVKLISVLMEIMLDQIEDEDWDIKSVGGKCDMYIARLDGVEHIR